MASIPRRSRFTTLPVIAAAAVFSTAFLTATAFANAMGMFETLDEDRNGRLVPEELEGKPALGARFVEADLNRDGELSLPEFEAMLALPGAAPGLE